MALDSVDNRWEHNEKLLARQLNRKNFIINILLENDYPLKFIFETLNDRIKTLIKKSNCMCKTSINIAKKQYIR
ncbi:hypothetical protein ALC57_18443 [Trachymyrmex cornetzi]|uniref:Uncharacterized protein n=1 Tax=Trachymyrmex cornetzi TaxID=471704 RepID=A0A151IRX7_9HYME|nr:hypothetical protein ALC57_18443 [Trachymyrmex cornetzi]